MFLKGVLEDDIKLASDQEIPKVSFLNPKNGPHIKLHPGSFRWFWQSVDHSEIFFIQNGHGITSKRISNGMEIFSNSS